MLDRGESFLLNSTVVFTGLKARKISIIDAFKSFFHCRYYFNSFFFFCFFHFLVLESIIVLPAHRKNTSLGPQKKFNFFFESHTNCNKILEDQ